jgi:glyoxylase-like metal-dependent hydrolase (beta-lactamase superfamily II)
VCLYQPEHRLLISGDHLLGRVSLYFDYGWSPDPVGEFLESLEVVAGLDARLGCSGHGKPFVDVPGHIEATRRLVDERLDAVLRALDGKPQTAVQIAPAVYGGPVTERNAAWWLAETLCFLRHLEARGRVRHLGDGAERWAVAGPSPPALQP